MVESQHNKVTLPEEDAFHFDVIVGFMYTGGLERLETLQGEGRSLECLKATVDNKDQGSNIALRLHHAATKYGMPELQNCIIDRLFDWYSDYLVCPGKVVWAYQNMG